MKIYYANNKGQYSESHTRSVDYDMAPIQKPAIRMELDHEVKYRFLAMQDNGDILPLYDPKANILGGGGDIVLTFTNYEGGGFEFCDLTTQSLTRGSQYQTSFLPEMQNGSPYKVKVKAAYKDYLPIEFDLAVKYLPNLDGKTKFVDLGTHIFYKSAHNSGRPVGSYKFWRSNVID
jgi:hypothetical protein